jgi:ubiquinone/menaquinone biosynthesis C-methylase UbiE
MHSFLVSRSALDLGCGYSDVCGVLKQQGLGSVCGVDILPAPIRYLSEKYGGEEPGMRFMVGDVTDLSPEFPCDGEFDLVVDKTTMDALLCDCNEQAAAMMICEASRLLRPGGVMVVISIHSQVKEHTPRTILPGHLSSVPRLNTI